MCELRKIWENIVDLPVRCLHNGCSTSNRAGFVRRGACRRTPVTLLRATAPIPPLLLFARWGLRRDERLVDVDLLAPSRYDRSTSPVFSWMASLPWGMSRVKPLSGPHPPPHQSPPTPHPPLAEAGPSCQGKLLPQLWSVQLQPTSAVPGHVEGTAERLDRQTDRQTDSWLC